jgi:hypothetical protein
VILIKIKKLKVWVVKIKFYYYWNNAKKDWN